MYCTDSCPWTLILGDQMPFYFLTEFMSLSVLQIVKLLIGGEDTQLV